MVNATKRYRNPIGYGTAITIQNWQFQDSWKHLHTYDVLQNSNGLIFFFSCFDKKWWIKTRWPLSSLKLRPRIPLSLSGLSLAWADKCCADIQAILKLDRIHRLVWPHIGVAELRSEKAKGPWKSWKNSRPLNLFKYWRSKSEHIFLKIPKGNQSY